jgi:ribonuclease R
MKPNFNSDLLEQAIVDIVTKENGRPIPAGIILAKYRKSKPKASFANDVIYHAIHQLIKKGIFKQTFKSKSIVLTENRTPKVNMSNLQEGKIAIISSGSGFITLDNQTKAQFFVHKSNLNGALNEDRVQFAQIEKYKQNDLLDATVTKVISHAKDFYVGIINIDSENHYTVKIDDDKFYLPIKLDNIQGLVNGQKILIKIVQFDKDSAHATISRIIGHVSDPGVDILSILYDNGVEPEFDDTVLNYARDIKLNIDDYQRKIRRDLTKLPIVTIDPATSKDFDDAIHVSKSDDKFVLTVSIADVSHYVKFKSVLDEVAQKRGCSIYLVDRVIPMLPHNLSDDICSLNPQVERLTLTCEMLINSNGKFEDIKVYPSIIKSHRRFSYDEVNAYFSKQVDFHDESLQVKQMIDDALTLHKILDKNKKDRGYIAFNIPEPIILVDKQGVPIEIKKRESGTAQKMIEDFMIAANEAVTIYAQKRN